ncbi:site-specific integrase [Ligilactobacillus salivarius]|uniref:site-specific integrase n=1 Tax=Ligilactobacillus salivarius TaxID=1624 RepID=UPI00237D7665|nr:site-specific integrase [Ligilactobacillus salivarius]MDE1500764.1 site-specific integrase [Ligilactobacillus salivarius]MDE1543241.1 site-specific integrase [Ligilactobacillus salivarius]
MATFRKYKTKKGMLWRYQILVGTDTVTGKRKYKTKGGFYTKREAKLAADEVEKKMSNPNFLDNENITFGEVYERWIANYKLTVKESSFYTVELQYKSKILPILRNKKINQITTIECQDLINHWYSIPLKNYKAIFNLITRIFKYAKQLKIVTDDPTSSVIIPKASRQFSNLEHSRNYYTRDELKTFLEYAEKHEKYKIYVLFRLLAFSGIRKSEALALTWNDINFDKAQITINKTIILVSKVKVTTPKTKSSNRTVFIDKKTLSILSEWRLRQKKELLQKGFNALSPNQLIFPDKNNHYIIPTTISKMMNRVSEGSNLHHITVHGLRHTYATLAAQGGMSVKQLQAQLGHSKVEITLDVYTSITDEQRKDTANQYTSFVNF